MEILSISLYELDQLIELKRGRARRDLEREEEEHTLQQALNKVLLKEYQEYRNVFLKRASDKLAPHQEDMDLKIELTGNPSMLTFHPLYKHTLEELEGCK